MGDPLNRSFMSVEELERISSASANGHRHPNKPHNGALIARGTGQCVINSAMPGILLPVSNSHCRRATSRPHQYRHTDTNDHGFALDRIRGGGHLGERQNNHHRGLLARLNAPIPPPDIRPTTAPPYHNPPSHKVGWPCCIPRYIYAETQMNEQGEHSRKLSDTGGHTTSDLDIDNFKLPLRGGRQRIENASQEDCQGRPEVPQHDNFDVSEWHSLNQARCNGEDVEEGDWEMVENEG
ncbi:hypothetical protein MMC28_001427 [Mycoblastus sanguinarius]|nr:hypothetical protein [Mycoblastus sanguinarius]